MKSNAAKKLIGYIETKSPIIYINNFDFTLVDRMIKLCVEKARIKRVIEYDCALGAVNIDSKVKAYDIKSLAEFLEQEEQEGFTQQSNVNRLRKTTPKTDGFMPASESSKDLRKI